MMIHLLQVVIKTMGFNRHRFTKECTDIPVRQRLKGTGDHFRIGVSGFSQASRRVGFNSKMIKD